MDISIADVTVTQDESGEARVGVGDLATNKGFASNVSLWGSEGFIGLPNGPDTTQPPSACQALVGTSGNIRIVFAPRDERYRQKAGMLAAGDRAITSNCDAAMLLSQAQNLIQFLAVAQGMSIKLDAANEVVVLAAPHCNVTLAPSVIEITFNDGVAVAAISLSAGGVSITTPTTVKVNGVSLTVP